MNKRNIVIIGSSGGIGSALIAQLLKDKSNRIYGFSRSEPQDLPESANLIQTTMGFCNEESVENASNIATNTGALDLVIVATGILHNDTLNPEKSLRDITIEKFEQYFFVNTILPAMIAKHFLPKLRRDTRAVFAALSARVGSISDNRLGGWYGYRASKSALNMIIKNASIEIGRTRKNVIVVGLHPGTVATELSRPFQHGVPKHKLFDSTYSASKLIDVLDSLEAKDSGNVFAWDRMIVPS